MQNEPSPCVRPCELAKAHPPSSLDVADAVPALAELVAPAADLEPAAPSVPPETGALLAPASPAELALPPLPALSPASLGIAPDGPSASSAVRDNTA